MAVIAPALLWRYVFGWTWVEIQARLCGGLDPAMPSLAMPSLDSLIRWGKAFERQAMAWLNGLIVVLAVVMPQYVQVNEPATFAQVFARMALLARWLTHTAVGSDQTASLDDISFGSGVTAGTRVGAGWFELAAGERGAAPLRYRGPRPHNLRLDFRKREARRWGHGQIHSILTIPPSNKPCFGTV